MDSIELAKRLTGKIDALDVSTGGISRDMKMTPAEPQDKAAGGTAYQAVRIPFPYTLLESHMLMNCYLSADRVAHQAGRE